MTGIFLLLVAATWLALVIWLSKMIARRVPIKWRVPVGILMSAVLLPLPVIDEIVGGRQFSQLCKENSTIEVDRLKAAGKTVYLARVSDVEIKGTWVRIVLQPRRFVDATTGETLVAYNGLIAVGGHLIQKLKLSEGRVPLTFRGWCKPSDQHALEKLFKELKITLVPRPEKNTGDTK